MVARLLSFTKAAETLHMTQPAVTFQVRQLEEYFNTRLFDRTHNRISLTEAGTRVYGYADKIFELYGQMENAVREMTGETSGTLTIGASTTIAEYMLPPLLGDFKAEYPEVNIHLKVSNSEGIVRMVENNTIDLGVIEAPVTNKNLVVEECRKDQLVAIAAVERDMRMMSARMVDSLPAEDIALFDALIMILRSENLVDGTIERIREGNWAPAALHHTIAEHVSVFEDMEDPYLRERASDVRDLGRRILDRLQSIHPAARVFPEGTILVGEDVSASQLAEVPAQKLVGVVSASGSSASHVAILARALGIPAVMGVDDLPVSRLEGQPLVVDGYQSRVFVRPSVAIRQEFERLQKEEEELSEELLDLIELPAETTDGLVVPLYANTGLLTDITPSLRCGAEGVGLYRTEIPFMVRDRFPGEEEQRRTYRQVLEAFAPAPVTVRTLDIGGDKSLPYFPVVEENPFLGWRGIRISLDHPEIFLTQVRAILRANADLNNLQLLLPMITDAIEIDAALGLIRRAYEELREEGEHVAYPKIGVMIEVPSAVYQVAAMAKRVDFFSIGSNDLTQYLLAVDRNNARVAALYDSLHPAVLRAIRQVADQAEQADRPVSVCGEMAGDPAAALLLLGMGIKSLSMSAASLLRVKWAIRSFSAGAMRDLLEEVWELEDARAVRALMNSALENAGLGGLVRAGR